MDRNRLEEELRSYFLIQANKAKPSLGWWSGEISRLGKQNRHALLFGFIPKTRLAWVILPLIILLIGGTVYGASTIIREIFQNFAPQIETAGLAEDLNLSQTIDGVTVSLERAYSDSNIILLGFIVSGPENTYYTSSSHLTTAEGITLPGMLGMGFVPGSDAILGNWQLSERQALIMAFDASSINGAHSSINLILETNVSGSPATEEAVTGPFKFEFAVPFNIGKTINIGQTVEAADIQVTLKSVVTTYWGTRAVLQLPSGGQYMAITSLVLPDRKSVNCSFSKSEGDYSIQYFAGDFSDQFGEFNIVVSELINNFTSQQRISGPWTFQFQVDK